MSLSENMMAAVERFQNSGLSADFLVGENRDYDVARDVYGKATDGLQKAYAGREHAMPSDVVRQMANIEKEPSKFETVIDSTDTRYESLKSLDIDADGRIDTDELANAPAIDGLNDIIENLRIAFEGHANTVAAAAGLDQNDIALKDSDATLKAAHELMEHKAEQSSSIA